MRVVVLPFVHGTKNVPRGTKIPWDQKSSEVFFSVVLDDGDGSSFGERCEMNKNYFAPL